MIDFNPAVAHIVSQTQSNLQFLVSHSQLEPEDVRAVLDKLTRLASQQPSLASRMENLHVAPARQAPEPIPVAHVPSIPTVSAPIPNHSPSALFKAKAVWGYNEHSEEQNDLSFRAGDVIEVVTETNPDWWTGRFNGREGLFPSNYVERLQGPSRPPPPAPPSRSPNSESFPGFPNSPDFHPSVYPPHNQYPSQHPPPLQYPTGNLPPSQYPGQFSPTSNRYPSEHPPPSQYPGHYSSPNQYPPSSNFQPPAQQPPNKYPYNSAPPPAPAQVQVVPAPAEQPPKKHKFGGNLGNTLAQSAVGGLGFGAGSAVGSGIVNSIF